MGHFAKPLTVMYYLDMAQRRARSSSFVFLLLGALLTCVSGPAPVHATVVSIAPTTRVVTNDTFLDRQWYLDSIHAREGWMTATGSHDVVVAVIDSGVDIDHPDIRNNLWVNPNEIAGNGKDDDGDGYTDDVHGWNFVTDSPDVRPVRDPNAIPEAWIHGTAVASLIAAGGNDDIGISGVAWRARIMPLVVLGPDGYGRDDAIINAIHYAVTHGADIINLSLVGYDFDPGLSQAIHEATAQGVLVVSAAGNSDTDPNGEDLDKLPGYPACDKGAAGRGALSVTALDRNDVKASLANYGTCVDVSAPGQDLFAARPTTDASDANRQVAGYTGGLDGTSVAAPLVSGLAVLLKAEHPSWKGPEIAERIISTTDPIDAQNPAFAGKLGRGKIDVARAVANDAGSARLGPLTLEVAAAGHPPEVRVRTEDGTELSHFLVADGGDTRGVRATFVRWQGNAEPDIAATIVGDTSGAWRVYRPDGLLIAAGNVGSPVAGGLNLAAEDLGSQGADDLFLGERSGPHAWLVSSSGGNARPLSLFKATSTRGVEALSVGKPTPAFLVTTAYGPRDIRVIGEDGVVLVEAHSTALSPSGVLEVQRASRKGGGELYGLITPKGSLVFVDDANGLHASMETYQINRWDQIPEGEPTDPGWLYVGSWPR